MRRRVLLLVLTLIAGATTTLASAAPATVEVKPWEPRPASRPLYGISPPDTNAAVQIRRVVAADGVEIYTETYLPADKGGRKAPARVPTILLMDPYLTTTPGLNSDFARERDHLVTRGYAFTYAHLRGTGFSGGCWGAIGSTEIDDAARVIEHLGRDVPWTNGRVGMFGASYSGDIQVAVAGRGDPQRTKYLKAVVPVLVVGGQYEVNFFDGVMNGYAQTAGNFAFNTAVVASFRAETNPAHIPQRLECRSAELAADLDRSGDMTAWWRDHEYRAAAPRIRAAMLLVQGLADPQKDPGPLFQNLPRSTPHKLITGWWEHTLPEDEARRVHPEWALSDWLPAITAWFDRYLLGLDTKVESWPAVQVQGSDGQWRAERNWPTTGGPVGQLALGPDGALGVASPSGSTTYTETLSRRNDLPSNLAVFETSPIPGRLQLTGQPVADLWVSLSKPDAHVAVRLEVLDGAGALVEHAITVGARSAQHVAPLVAGRFVQEEGVPAPVGTPLRIQVRLDVVDLVVPLGGKIRLTIAGSVRNEYPPPRDLDTSAFYPLEYVYDPLITHTAPSGEGTTVKVLHDCAHPSALRFLKPRERPALLNLREPHETGPLRSLRVPTPSSNGAGLATAPVCGIGPARLPMFGPRL